MTRRIEFTKEECYTDFKTFYERLWNKYTDLKVDDQADAFYSYGVEFNKLCITGSYWLLKQIHRYYECEMDAYDDEIMRIFMFYGPKQISDEDGYFVEVENGWWTKKEENK